MWKQIFRKALATWLDLSVSKKLFGVFGIMALLIGVELFTLSFAMGTLSSVRAFVEGEALWSKAQKDAVNHLQLYITSKDPGSFQSYRERLEIPLGDHQARLELLKPNPQNELIVQGFLRGQIHRKDIDGMIKLLRRFHGIHYIRDAIAAWTEADQSLAEMFKLGDDVDQKIHRNQFSRADAQAALVNLDRINDRLTSLEVRFSSSLGAGSRWLEDLLWFSLLMLVLFVESTGVTLTFLFSRQLSLSLEELSRAATKIGQGEFSHRVAVKSKDELGDLAHSINKMAEELQSNVGRRVEAEQSSQAKSIFLANMSHEIRTPLASILSFASLLGEENLPPKERKEYLEIVMKAGKNLTDIISDILDISKVESGHLTIEKMDYSLVELLQDLKKFLNLRCEEKGLLLDFQTSNIPTYVRGDPARLRQVLMNILSNAMKYTEHGAICLYAEQQGDRLIFDVVDTGVGIPQGERDIIFEIFEQGRAGYTQKQAGTGLGLPLSKHLAQMMGGDLVLVESTPGRGSHFRATVRFEAAPEIGKPNLKVAGSTFKEKLPPSKTQVDLSKLKVLAAEDNEDNRHFLKIMLGRWGAHADFAKNGKEAVDLASAQKYDVILMDLQMPILGGMEAVKVLRGKGLSTPIVALSAHAMKDFVKSCLEAGFTDFLSKPVASDQLVQVLSRYS